MALTLFEIIKSFGDLRASCIRVVCEEFQPENQT